MDIIRKFSGQVVHRNTGMVRVLGIDLGTTNSVVAESVSVPGYPPMCRVVEIVQPLETGSFKSITVPSFVALRGTGKTVLVGEGARRLRTCPGKDRLVRGKNYFYETKNDMGLNKTYPMAPPHMDRSWKVAGHILAFLAEAADRDATAPCRSVTVTVPASFQMNQRNDTLRAAQFADLHLSDENLMEEPTAALIDYLMSDECRLTLGREGESACLVFDFGGGTCDVSVIAISANGPGRQLALSELSVSRYHRLGGGDIDTAIVHDVLIPAIMKEYGLQPLSLTWEDKKLALEPQLSATAEALKIKLCRTIREMESRGIYADADKESLRVTAPPITCKIWDKIELKLSSPSLSAARFEKLLEPFIDTDILYPRETEYRLTQSIFAPIEDALDRAGLSHKDIDFCLLTGGSALLPQVRRAVEDYFGPEKVGGYSDPEKIQSSVARGAAWSAIFRAMTGKPLIQPVLHDGIDLVTNDGGRYPLVEAGTPLPWPEDDAWCRTELEAPVSGLLFMDKLRIKLVSHSDGRHLLNEVWKLSEAAVAGEDIVMEYRLTAGKQFECRAFLADAPNQKFVKTVENPLVNVVNPGTVRLKIEEAEEKLRSKKGGGPDDVDDFINLARWHAEINQNEKALHYLKTALRKKEKPDAYILNLMGIYYDNLNDCKRAEKSYMEALRTDEYFNTARFNLALLYRNTKRYDNALAIIESALEKEDEDMGPFMSLKATVLDRMGRESEAMETAEIALELYDPLENLDKWALGWYMSTARFLKDDQALAEAEDEKDKRTRRPEPAPDDSIPKPVAKSGIIPFHQIMEAS